VKPPASFDGFQAWFRGGILGICLFACTNTTGATVLGTFRDADRAVAAQTVPGSFRDADRAFAAPTAYPNAVGVTGQEQRLRPDGDRDRSSGLQPDPNPALHDANLLLARYGQLSGDLPLRNGFIIRPSALTLHAPGNVPASAGPRPSLWQLGARLRWHRSLREARIQYRRDLQEYSARRSALLQVLPDTRLRAGSARFNVRLEHIRTATVYNSKLAHGTNLEAIFPSRGLTSLWSVQASARFGPLHLRLNPTVFYNESARYETLDIELEDFVWRYHYQYLYNRIDRPNYYRNAPYLRLVPGNSEALLVHRGIAAGVSTRSFWWGPGHRNALLMTNNAEGFLHATIRSERPLRTPAGDVEFQAFWGRLEASGMDHRPPRRFGNTLPMNYIARPDDWRLLQGFAFSWSPRWTPGLTVGAGRTILAYSEDIKRWDQALFSFFRTPYEDIPETRLEQLEPDLRHKFDDKFALYIRYVAPGDQLEVYGEWGRNARPASWRDFTELPEHGMAWILGMNKLFPLGSPGHFVRIGSEFTQLEKTNSWRVRDYPTWYMHPHVHHGYTHRGQILGAGIGPGSNAQYLGLDYLRGTTRIGAYVERTIYNNDLYYIMFTTTRYRHYADVNLGLDGQFTWQRLTVSGRLSFIQSLNYQYKELTEIPGEYIGYDVWNTHLQLQLLYRF